MTIVNKRESVVLFLGDIIFFYFSLWMMLFLRYKGIPNAENIHRHFLPFSILFLSWLVVFFIAGLYEKRTTFMKNVLPVAIFKVQVVNSVIAVLFFYFIPFFSIAPKTNLFVYLVVSTIIFVIWRVYIARLFNSKTKQDILLIARGFEMKKLKNEINNGNYGFQISHSINLKNVESINIKEDIIDPIYSNNISTVIIDTRDDSVIPLLPHFYNLMFANVEFVDAHETYEYLFNSVPLSLVKHGWFLENVRSKPHLMYDALKRLMDIFISIFIGIISLVFYPFVILALKIEDGKEIFSIQERTGRNNKKIKLIKFRTMTLSNDEGDWAEKGKENKITKVGNFLRKTRIDELPQIWNVLKGDISLIGPRPEFAGAVLKYSEDIPYYNVRHLIKPGLSGWAQIYHDNHPHHGIDIDATKEKLSFDLFYVKNRSFFLDLKIALKTLKTLLLRKGR